MPTDTFMKLSEEKKDKIIIAAKKEFARVPLEEASIKNIVENAAIARGSFYQYFESKEDLLTYIMHSHMEKVEEIIKKTIEKSNGDIFEVFIVMYDFMTIELFNKTDIDFHKRIFENLKTSEDTLFSLKESKEDKKETHMSKIYNLIDRKKLKIQNENDIKIIIRMLYAITRKALVSNFKYSSQIEARKEYLQEIEYLKYGICKN